MLLPFFGKEETVIAGIFTSNHQEEERGAAPPTNSKEVITFTFTVAIFYTRY